MNQTEIREWVKRNKGDITLTTEDIYHVAMCLEHIQKWYFEGYPLGSFLTAIVNDNFCEACFRADDINLRALKLYAYFMHNHLPDDWREKANKGR